MYLWRLYDVTSGLTCRCFGTLAVTKQNIARSDKRVDEALTKLHTLETQMQHLQEQFDKTTAVYVINAFSSRAPKLTPQGLDATVCGWRFLVKSRTTGNIQIINKLD